MNELARLAVGIALVGGSIVCALLALVVMTDDTEHEKDNWPYGD